MEISASPLHRRLQCLKWVLEPVGTDGLAILLRDDGVISPTQMVEYSSAYDKAEWLFILLEKAEKDGNIQLLHYEWSLFPRMKARVQVVTPKRSLVQEREEA